jgi:hypothetical protein
MKQGIRKKIPTLLDQHRSMTLRLLGPDGWPQAATVGYADQRLTLCFPAGRWPRHYLPDFGIASSLG